MGRAIALISDAATAPFARPLAPVIAFFRALAHDMFSDYRPELHYMRGPGPACVKTGRTKI
jgi:hypothetical protein